jgi:hypothetical protein
MLTKMTEREERDQSFTKYLQLHNIGTVIEVGPLSSYMFTPP